MNKYYDRISDDILRFKLVLYMQNLKERNQNIELAKNALDLFLEGATPKLIDEWQIIPFIWD